MMPCSSGYECKDGVCRPIETPSPTTNLPSYCQYDFDNSKSIDLGDLNYVLENWSDFNNGFSDYLLLILQYWGMGGC